MSPRLVISDIDGTLVRSDKTLSDGVVAAAKRLEAAGVPFSLISARPPSGMLWIAERLGLHGQLGAFNGGTIVDPDGTIVSAVHLDEDVARTAIGLLDRPDVSLWLFARGLWYARDLDNPHVPHEVQSAGIDPTPFTDPAAVEGPFDKIVGVCDDHAFLAGLEADVVAALGEGATVARSQLYYLDVTAARADKGYGIAALAEAAGVSLEAVAVIGDQRNDLPMFARAGVSIAMGQGPEDVRAKVMHVTRSNDEDGVAFAIDEIILPTIGR